MNNRITAGRYEKRLRILHVVFKAWTHRKLVMEWPHILPPHNIELWAPTNLSRYIDILPSASSIYRH